MKMSALITGEFRKTEHGFTGKRETLGIKANIPSTLTAQRNLALFIAK